jgi:AcrR family transcriptional regulator
MQRRLLEATIESLSEKGYGATTTLEVQQRAGVSRGALLHHYGSRADLMVAAVEHLCRQRAAEVLALVQEAAPKRGRVAWAVRVLWRTFDGPLFLAALELWLAARHDEELLAVLLPQERILGHTIRSMSLELFGPTAQASSDFPQALELLLDAMRGAAARRVLTTDESEERLLQEWTALMEAALTKRQS